MTPAPTIHTFPTSQTQPTQTQPPQTQPPPSIRTTASSRPITQGSKFILELNEPGDELPNQTRKFLLYFQSIVVPHINDADNTITFTPQNGGTYSGFMQLAYLGAGLRGDHSNDTVLDKHLGACILINPRRPTVCRTIEPTPVLTGIQTTSTRTNRQDHSL